MEMIVSLKFVGLLAVVIGTMGAIYFVIRIAIKGAPLDYNKKVNELDEAELSAITLPFVPYQGRCKWFCVNGHQAGNCRP